MGCPATDLPANLPLRLLRTCLERNDRDCAVLSTLTKWLETGFWSSQLSWRALIFLYTTGRSASTASPTIGRMIWGSKMMPSRLAAHLEHRPETVADAGVHQTPGDDADSGGGDIGPERHAQKCRDEIDQPERKHRDQTKEQQIIQGILPEARLHPAHRRPGPLWRRLSPSAVLAIRNTTVAPRVAASTE